MRRILASFFALIVLCVLARAQREYPTRPITLVVPYAAGGPSDVIARLIGQSMTATLGQQIVIENVAGAGGTTGAYGSPTPARMARRCSFTISRLPQHTRHMAISGTRQSKHSSPSASSTAARSY